MDPTIISMNGKSTLWRKDSYSIAALSSNGVYVPTLTLGQYTANAMTTSKYDCIHFDPKDIRLLYVPFTSVSTSFSGSSKTIA